MKKGTRHSDATKLKMARSGWFAYLRRVKKEIESGTIERRQVERRLGRMLGTDGIGIAKR